MFCMLLENESIYLKFNTWLLGTILSSTTADQHCSTQSAAVSCIAQITLLCVLSRFYHGRCCSFSSMDIWTYLQTSQLKQYSWNSRFAIPCVNQICRNPFVYPHAVYPARWKTPPMSHPFTVQSSYPTNANYYRSRERGPTMECLPTPQFSLSEV